MDAYRFNEALGEVLRYSLLGRQSQDQTLSMHRLVQAVLQDTLSEGEQRVWTTRAMLAIDAAFPEVEFGAWSQCERLLPHALVCVAQVEDDGLIHRLEASNVLNKAGTYLRERGLHTEAEPLLVQALSIREQLLGIEHPDTAVSLHNLAVLYWQQGKYEQAEPLLHCAHVAEKTLPQGRGITGGM